MSALIPNFECSSFAIGIGWEKLKLVMQLMDQLEQDYRSIYPEELPVMEEGLEEALRQMVTK
jgi:hypothetical protein